VSIPDPWFAGGPSVTSTLGTVPGTGVRYAIEPFGSGIWAVSCRPVARQQRERAEEFAVMPDALLHGMGYRLGTLAGARIPAGLLAVIERGPEVLNRVTHPHEPALIRIDGVDVLALRRTFESLRIYVGIVQSDYWIIAVCPIDEPAVLVAAPA
jgi:hypothetical protein